MTSREPGAEGASNDGVAQEEEQPRVDNQGFKIPTKIMKPQTRRAPQTESHVSQATVLVEDSQAQIPAKKPQSSSAMLQQKLKLNSVRPRSVPANHSSPTEAAAARATTVAPRPQAARGSRQKNTATPQAAEVAQKAGHSRETLPTPVSGNNRRSSNEAPTSAQRPRNSQAPMSDQSRRFVQRNAPEPDGDIAQDDPIEDVDDFLLQAVDEGGVDNGHASVVSVTPPSHQDAQASDDEFDDEGLLAEDFENSQRVNELTGSKGLVEPVQTSSTTSIGHQSSSQNAGECTSY